MWVPLLDHVGFGDFLELILMCGPSLSMWRFRNLTKSEISYIFE